jgi:hypothetical protein
LLLNPGAYAASLSIVDTNGCASPQNTLSATVYSNPIINYNGPSSICGQSVDLNAAIALDPQDPMNQLIWLQNGQTIGSGNPFLLLCKKSFDCAQDDKAIKKIATYRWK